MRPAWLSACPMSVTPPCAFPAPAASRSATWPTSDPERLNWVMADAAISAASPTSISPAAASARAPLRPPPRMSAEERPALASCSIAPAASVAENAVSAPASIAASRSWSRLPRASSPVAATADIALSNCAKRVTAPAARPTRLTPTAPTEFDSVSIEAALRSMYDVDRFENSPTAFCAARSCDCRPAMLAPMRSMTVRSATVHPRVSWSGRAQARDDVGHERNHRRREEGQQVGRLDLVRPGWTLDRRRRLFDRCERGSGGYRPHRRRGGPGRRDHSDRRDPPAGREHRQRDAITPGPLTPEA